MENLAWWKIMVRGNKMCGLYVLNSSTVIGHVLVTSQDSHDKYELCDFRLGHVKNWQWSEVCFITV